MPCFRVSRPRMSARRGPGCVRGPAERADGAGGAPAVRASSRSEAGCWRFDATQRRSGCVGGPERPPAPSDGRGASAETPREHAGNGNGGTGQVALHPPHGP